MLWETHEKWLHDKADTGQLIGTDWTAVDIAFDTGLPIELITSRIQAYGRAQHRKRGRQTAYVQHRVAGTRTRNARWVYGHRIREARDLHEQLGNDIRCRVDRVINPDLDRMAKQNPKIATQVEALKDTIEYSLKLLHSMAVASSSPNGDE